MGITKFSNSFNRDTQTTRLATYTATTGSPTVDTTSRPGKTILKYTGSGTITIGFAGFVEMFMVGGGGGGNANTLAGGAGGSGFVVIVIG